MKTLNYFFVAALASAGPAAAAEPETPAYLAARADAAPGAGEEAARGHSYWEDENYGVWLQFRQDGQDSWSTAETDPFARDRIEVNVRRSGFSGDFDVDYAAGFGRDFGTIRFFASRFELDGAGTRVTAEKRLDDYRIEGYVRLENGRSARISLDMEREFNGANYLVRSQGLTLNINRFGMTGEALDAAKYPKKVLAVLAAMSMAILQSPENGF